MNFLHLLSEYSFVLSSTLLRNVSPLAIGSVSSLLLCSLTSQFSYARLQQSDPVHGVDMASTGEVGCIGDDFSEALLKSLLSVGYKMPRKKKVLVSSGETKSKVDLLDTCKMLKNNGYDICATGGTYKFLCENNVASTLVGWPDEDDAPLKALEMIENQEFDFVVNIPKNSTQRELQNGFRVRRAAVDFNTPLFTNARLASAFIRSCCEMTFDDIKIKSWDEY